MQSGYGGVSEIQQFMVDGCPSSLFSISTPPPNPTEMNSVTAANQHKFHQVILPHHHQQHHHHQHHQHQPQHHHQPPPPPPHFSHFHPIPITQQLFQQTHHQHQQQQQHQFNLFHHQQQQQHQQALGLDQESAPENSNSSGRIMNGGGGGGPSFLTAAMNFKLAVNESSGGGGGSRDGLNDDDGILQGDDGSESRLHPWHREEESPNIKQPFWRPLDIDYINRNNKRPSEDKQPEITSSKYSKKTKEGGIQQHQDNTTAAAAAAADSNYKIFSELEAICKPGGGSTISGGGGNNNNNNTTHQTGSGSVLTGDDNPLIPNKAPGPEVVDTQPDHGSDTSNGGDTQPPALKKFQKGSASSGARRKRTKRKQQQQLTSIASFFESLVKQLMDHQEGLHQKFLEVMERRDQERTNREEAWRKQEAAKSSREASTRAQERALTANREAAIISFLEKITGESLNLPTKPQIEDESLKDLQDDYCNNPNYNAMEPYIGGDDSNNNKNSTRIQLNSSRWPKAEVQALIKVRSGLESRFQEPGLKGPLWEEVSSNMASMGYHRSAKRCKEKWENINKYFRKTKDSRKKRPPHSKTCPYFHQLDQLYSKSIPNSNTPPSSSNANNLNERKDNSELLDAIVVSTDHQGFKYSEIESLSVEFNNNDDGCNDISGSRMAGKMPVAELGDGNEEEEEEDDDEEEGEGEEGEGESQLGQAQFRESLHQEQRRHQLHDQENQQHDSTLFFHHLHS